MSGTCLLGRRSHAERTINLALRDAPNQKGQRIGFGQLALKLELLDAENLGQPRTIVFGRGDASGFPLDDLQPTDPDELRELRLGDPEAAPTALDGQCDFGKFRHAYAQLSIRGPTYQDVRELTFRIGRSQTAKVADVLERAQYVALLRKHRGKQSLDAVAKDLGTRRTEVIRWEKVDGTGPGPEYAAKLADYYRDERLRHPPRKGHKFNVNEAGLERLLSLLREAVSTLEHVLDADRPQS